MERQATGTRAGRPPWAPVVLVRRLISLPLWAVSRLVKLGSDALYGISIGIDYLRLVYLDYVARPDDIFIVSYPRSGTTWLQMILYQLTTDGQMDIEHIAQVCPWFERAAVNKRNLERLPSPRVFKSHLPYRWIPKRNCRYVYVVRNGKDVAVSFYHFYKSHFRYRGSLSDFFARFMRGWVVYGSWFGHVRGWWRHRDDPRVLFLKYEDLLRDLEGCLRKIVEFCRLEVPPERFPQILERCSFAFMKEHEVVFDHATEVMWERGFRRSSFLRRGRAGEAAECLSREQAALFDRRCERSLGRLGLRFTAVPKAPAQQHAAPG